jgi:ferredoxin-NADP reductase
VTDARPTPWRVATVTAVRAETARVRTLALDLPGWPGHLAGQHVVVRLTSEDGYEAQRSYSIASAPGAPAVELTVERIEDGEVSPYLVDEVRPGDRFEVRGPVGGYFVWRPEDGGPLFLVAGGSGVVPLMAMLRHRASAGVTAPAYLLFSSRTLADVIYRDELERLASRGDGLTVVHTLTREAPSGWAGRTGRVDGARLAEGPAPSRRPRVFVCGPSGLVESASRALVALGHDPLRVKTERFGPERQLSPPPTESSTTSTPRPSRGGGLHARSLARFAAGRASVAGNHWTLAGPRRAVRADPRRHRA